MVIVFGSINIDIGVSLARLPGRGETVLGHGCVISPGGKGANQAHAARRAGAAVAMAGMVGADAFAAPALARLRAEGVDLSRVGEADEPTGCATIWVEEGTGASTIAVASGANTRVTHSQVPDELLDGEPVVLLQHEVPLDENRRLVERAARRGCCILLNAAPRVPGSRGRPRRPRRPHRERGRDRPGRGPRRGWGRAPAKPSGMARAPLRADGGRDLRGAGIGLPHRPGGDPHPRARGPAGGHDGGRRHVLRGARRDPRRGP